MKKINKYIKKYKHIIFILMALFSCGVIFFAIIKYKLKINYYNKQANNNPNTQTQTHQQKSNVSNLKKNDINKNAGPQFKKKLQYPSNKKIFNTTQNKNIHHHLQILSDKANIINDRIIAAEELGKMRAQEALALFMNIITDESEDVVLRYKVARGLGAIGDKSAIPTLSSVLLDAKQDEHLRIVSSLAIGNLGGVDAVKALSDALHDDNKSIRFKVLQGLERTGNATALEHIAKGLEDSDEYVRANAIYALGKLGDSTYVPIIIEILNNTTDNFIKIGCIDALGNLGGEEALAILNDYKDHPNKLLRINAERALQLISK